MDPTDRDSKLLQNVSNYLIYHAKFEVSIAVLLKIQVLLYVMDNINPANKDNVMSQTTQIDYLPVHMTPYRRRGNLYQRKCENLKSRIGCST